MHKIFPLLLIFVIGFFSFARAESLLYENSAGWWENDVLAVTGNGIAPDDAINRAQAKLLAKRAAMADGYRKLAEQVGEIHITAKKTINKRKVDAVIRNATFISEEYDELGNCTVVLSLPIYGKKNSVAKEAFKPIKKENFPPPSTLKEEPENNSEGNYTGLIIDCGDIELNPVLSPVIRNADNKSIYGYNNLDYEKVIEKGMIAYTKTDTKINLLPLKTNGGANKFLQVGSNFLFLNTLVENKSVSRAGSNPLIIKAESLSDDNTCPVLSTSDADKILIENQISHFLDEGAVVFTSRRIRGMRL